MANFDDCPAPRAGPQTRPQWKPGGYLTAGGCALEQNYRLQKFRRHNREMHGWGVLCGLWVVPAADGSQPWGVRICPGYALGPYGDEIELIQAARVNVEDFLWYQPSSFTGIASFQSVAYVALRYQDWSDGLTLVPNPPCVCDDPVYVEGRTGDGYEAGVIWSRFTRTGPTRLSPTLCRPESLPCAVCADSPWVVLAAITLPQSGVPLTASMINNGFRDSL